MDKLSRVTARKITSGNNTYTTNYTYTDVANTANKTTILLNGIKNGNNEEITYTYDATGNIETIKKGNTETNKYYYDTLNQLIRENSKNQTKTITYEYDAGGNIITKKEYPYTTASTLPTTPTKTITYGYGNTNWKDQLTNYNGKTITYDEIGNAKTYNGNTYTWQNGRQLAGISNTNQTITYKYNESGIRTQKTVNGVATNYYLDGTKVIYEKTGNNITYYTYDEIGNIIGLKYNDTQYYYIKNGQNDVIGILDSNLKQVVSYEYDSWGNILSIKDANGNNITSNTHIGIINPYRYRGYRYDTETGLYYLQSRYYSPEWGRFINADGTTLDEGADLVGHNMYLYCANNPINRIDATGKSLTIGTIFIVTGILMIVSTATQAVINRKKWNNAEDMFFNAIANTRPSEDTLNSLADKAKDSVEVKSVVKNEIKNSQGKNFENKTGSINFTSGDLYLAIGKANTITSGTKISNNTWNITMNISDRYNFDQWRKMDSFGSIANNFGYILQRIAALTIYDWDVTFSFIYNDD